MKENKFEYMLFNAIVKWFDDNGNYKRIDDIKWINYVCEETGMTKDQYIKLMNMDLLDVIAKSVETESNIVNRRIERNDRDNIIV